MSALGAAVGTRVVGRLAAGNAARRDGDRAELYISPRLLIAAVVLTGTVFGRFMADGHMKIAAALVLAACYAPLVLFDLSIALAAYIAVQFFQDLSIFSSGPNAMGVLVGLGWIGAVLGRRGRIAGLVEHRRTILALIVFCAWLSVTIAWAQRPGPAGTEASYWWIAALAFAVALTAPASPRALSRLALAFVAGSVISVAIGVLTGSLSTAQTAISQTAIQGRFTGGGGDPNVQAAGFVAAMFLIIGLLGLYRRRAPRVLLRQLLRPGHRRVPGHRVAGRPDRARGRGDRGAVHRPSPPQAHSRPRRRDARAPFSAWAWPSPARSPASPISAAARVAAATCGGWAGRCSPAIRWPGWGSATSRSSSPTTPCAPGRSAASATSSTSPTSSTTPTCNCWPRPGSSAWPCYLLVLVFCMRSTWSAIQRFESIGRRREADLARAVLMGVVGMSVALFFISDGDDVRLWVLLAMGPALATFAARAVREKESAAVLGRALQPVPAAPRPLPGGRA